MQIPLDELVTGHVDAVKIDVEGAEIEVLEGMNEMFSRNPALQLWVEWFPGAMKSAGRDPLDLPQRLQDIGFRDISAIDEGAQTIRSVEEVYALLASGTLPPSWYANLWARGR